MSPRRRMLFAVVVALVVVAGLIVGIRLVGDRSSASAAGATGPPAQDRPGTVLLVPGYGGSRDSLARLAARIEATGRDAEVLSLAGDGTGDLSAQVSLLDAAAEDAIAAGAPSVDVIGYSAGGVVTGLWIARDGGATKARRVITLGAPLHGTAIAATALAQTPDACPPACRQLAPGSAVLTELNQAHVGTTLPWLSIWTTDDETVVPPETARLDGATNIALQQLCPGTRVGHSQLPTDPAVTGIVLAALGPDPLDTAAQTSCAED